MASNPGKSITTSVPTISIKFHANDEQLEELYGSDDERKTSIDDKTLSVARKEKGSSSTGNIQESAEASPSKLSRRSNSTDIAAGDSSPPSDPWKFFTEIKGKIAKSVEEKMNKKKEKQQILDEAQKKLKDNTSDSEELSESSISKTAGIISTTEGAEMSSDDDASLKNDTSLNMFIPQTPALPVTPTLRQRFRLLKAKSENNSSTVNVKEGTVSLSGLVKIAQINSESNEIPSEHHKDEIESGVDALLQEGVDSPNVTLNSLECTVDNIGVDEDGNVVVMEMEGKSCTENVQTVFAPKGFSDFRLQIINERNEKNSYLFTFIIIGVSSIIYLLIQKYSTYLAGMIAGIFVTIFSYYIRNTLNAPTTHLATEKCRQNRTEFCVPPIKEYQPIVKYEGWMNEFPDNYDPNTYHINLTQPVYLRLERNLLKISNTKSKVPKRATWNENIPQKNLSHHRIYNLTGAKVALLPVGLAKVRQWSKKYPIYIALSNDQFKFDDDFTTSKESDDEKDESSPTYLKKNAGFSFRKKISTASMPQRFSKLYAEQDSFYTELDFPGGSDTAPPVHEARGSEEIDKSEQEDDSNLDENSWSNCTLDDSPTETKIYLFARTDREKECWFRRLSLATRPTASNNENRKKASIESILNETEYTTYMSFITHHFRNREIGDLDVNWVNALVGRLLFDCLCDEEFTQKIKERIRRKLAAIHLPYFIEELSITELNLGKTCPLLKSIGKPTLDERGLWIEMGLTYEGLVVLTLTTKLNLMKLKQPQPNSLESQKNRSAIFHSDVDDSAESSSDDETPTFLAENGVLTPPVNKSKKLMKMVDKIAESKFFQAATENKFIKRAMEGVSNTDLRLKVEIRALEGTLVVNIPPPPSDRIWLGFRPVPELLLSAHPIVGERNITFMHVTGLIEKKLIQEFQKLLVTPNMEDLYIPFMMSNFPA